MSGGWSTTPPRADETPSPPRAVGWWWLLGAFVVLGAALLAWRPWDGAPPVALPTTSPTPEVTAPEPSRSPAPLPSLSPSPTLTSTSNLEPGPTPPGQDTVFDLAGAQALFVTAEQVSSVLPDGVGPVAEPTTPGEPAGTWGLGGGTVIPASCLVARTVVGQQPPGYAVRDLAGGGLDYRQEVTLLDTTTTARREFATLVGTVDACAVYTEVDASGLPSRWTTQPAIEGEGLYPSIVQQVQLDATSGTTNGWRGHLLVGNAIVTWTAWTADDIDTLGPPDGLAGIVQDRALAAVRAAG